MNNEPNKLTEIFGEPISIYTRAQALDDGNLIDLTELASEAGWRFPVAVTAALWQVIQTIPKAHDYQDTRGRAWDVVCMAAFAARANRDSSRFSFELILHRERTRKKYVRLVADCGPGDHGEPVVTIGFPEDF